MARYTRKQRERALDLYERYGLSPADTIREIGYPSPCSLRVWYRERLAERSCGIESDRGRRRFRYSEEQRRAAVDHYLTHGRRLARTIRHMGYPCRSLLASWVDELAPGERSVRSGPAPDAVKRDAVIVASSAGMTASQVAEKIGVEAARVRDWKRKMLGDRGEAAAMSGGKTRAAPRDRGRPAGSGDGRGAPGDVLEELRSTEDALRARIEDMRLELAVLEGSVEIIKKGRGAVPENLSSAERARLVESVSERYGIPRARICRRVHLARSTYYYQMRVRSRPDRDADLLELVRNVFEGSRRRYGYRRVRLKLRSAGVIAGGRRIMRLMTDNGLVPLLRCARRYSSYRGEITAAPANLVRRDFHAARPNLLWVTDITEFRTPAGKVYLSPVVDCSDGMPVSWAIGPRPSADLANASLARACASLAPSEAPTIHSDRGCHYRWPGWIAICERNGLTRSMSAKGSSPDNAAAEGFFGRVKQEFFYRRSFQGVSLESFMAAPGEYLRRYRDERIKTKFGMSMMERRRGLGIAA